jgi:hypothetical protein
VPQVMENKVADTGAFARRVESAFDHGLGNRLPRILSAGPTKTRPLSIGQQTSPGYRRTNSTASSRHEMENGSMNWPMALRAAQMRPDLCQACAQERIEELTSR